VLIRSISLAAAALALCLPAHARAAAAQVTTPLGCVETVVKTATSPTGSSMAQGGTIVFRDSIAPGHGNVRSVYVPPGGDAIASAGDHVRVCLLHVPSKAGGCNPATDPRGLEFLVYVHTTDPTRQTNAAVYMNAEHNCGGA
jgi:hypothetical protein